ncbi:hypothetical protein AK812_SmicGene19412 [Symbiodinium microadriaticum]|uniref:Uncharacterized protein n=1 Tax=Symbiodinium microadriaticum TaxID=2951 RepID=A0A1Q9DSK0_SYMMI|nr:hypothetical protein AK812_SmicGene19412 [Symbiodinium microadriaticum]
MALNDFWRSALALAVSVVWLRVPPVSELRPLKDLIVHLVGWLVVTWAGVDSNFRNLGAALDRYETLVTPILRLLLDYRRDEAMTLIRFFDQSYVDPAVANTQDRPCLTPVNILPSAQCFEGLEVLQAACPCNGWDWLRDGVPSGKNIGMFCTPAEECPIIHEVFLDQVQYFSYNASEAEACFSAASTQQAKGWGNPEDDECLPKLPVTGCPGAPVALSQSVTAALSTSVALLLISVRGSSGSSTLAAMEDEEDAGFVPPSAKVPLPSFPVEEAPSSGVQRTWPEHLDRKVEGVRCRRFLCRAFQSRRRRPVVSSEPESVKKDKVKEGGKAEKKSKKEKKKGESKGKKDKSDKALVLKEMAARLLNWALKKTMAARYADIRDFGPDNWGLREVPGRSSSSTDSAELRKKRKREAKQRQAEAQKRKAREYLVMRGLKTKDGQFTEQVTNFECSFREGRCYYQPALGCRLSEDPPGLLFSTACKGETGFCGIPLDRGPGYHHPEKLLPGPPLRHEGPSQVPAALQDLGPGAPSTIPPEPAPSFAGQMLSWFRPANPQPGAAVPPQPPPPPASTLAPGRPQGPPLQTLAPQRKVCPPPSTLAPVCG